MNALRTVNNLIDRRAKVADMLDDMKKAHDDAANTRFPVIEVKATNFHRLDLGKDDIVGLMAKRVATLTEELRALDTKIARMADVAHE